MSGTLTRARLGNGLRVVVEEQPSTQVAAVAVHYGVGFRAEERSGLAHLFEHLMFQGEAGARLDHFQQVERLGGFCNASTRQDYTDFYNVVPAAAVADVIALEAGRMRAPKITEHAVAMQASVIREEILAKLRKPYGGLPWPRLSPVLFSSFANAHDGYGDYAALRDVNAAACEDFFARHYRPADAVLTVSGAVRAGEVLEIAERCFGGLPAGSAASSESFWEQPFADRVERAYHDPLAPMPALAMGQRVPDGLANPGAHLALSALAGVLAGGARSRLRERVRREHGTHVTFSARVGLFDFLDARDPDMWMLTAIHPDSLTAEQVLDVVDAELTALAVEGPHEDELARRRTTQVNAHHRAMDDPAARVRLLGRFALLFGGPELALDLPAHYAAVTAAEVAAAAAALRDQGCAVLRTLPGEGR